MRSIRLANTLLRFGSQGASRRLHAGLKSPQDRQHAILRRILNANQASRYGAEHGFGEIRSVEDFQHRVPVVDYDGLADWIDAIKRGEDAVLTSDPVLMMEKSGGSTAASKYIPYTAALRSEFQAATSAWLHDLYTHRPKLRGLGAYFSVSPASQQREVTAGGLRVGFEDDTEYFDPLERWVLSQLLLVPRGLGQVETIRSNRYVTLRHLLDSEDLGLVSVWNPSFLTLLLKEAETQGDRLVRDLRDGTLTPPDPLPAELHQALARGLRRRPKQAERLSSLLRSGNPLLGSELWPNLQLISCWTDAMASLTLPELVERFPGVEIQGKGLLATEGVVSFPLLDHPGGLLAIDSHFYEFLPADSPDATPQEAHALEVGGRYSVLLTTGGGLYRYALGDLIEVIGKIHSTPLIRFLGKTGKVSDLVGEKLNELHVGAALAAPLMPLGDRIRFAMVAPEWGSPPYYALFLEAPDLSDANLDALASQVDACLRRNHHYAYAQDLGQLGGLRAVRVPENAPARYLQACEELGQKVGNIKPVYLHQAMGWTERFLSVSTPESSLHG